MVRQARVRRGVVVAQGDRTVSGVSGRYATALFELAQEANSVDQIGTDLATFQTLMDESDDLRRLVRSPVFSAEDQISALEAICAEAQIKSLALNFIKLAAQNRRLFVLSDMIKAYKTLVAQSRGEISAEVTSADTLSSKHLDDLKVAIKASVGRDVHLSTRVDPTILGGLVVKVGSRMVDNSLKTKLKNLKIAMKEIG
jgi:F-type H+-transporting ATPase subunit delta